MYRYTCEVCKCVFAVAKARHERAVKDPKRFTPKSCSMSCNRIRLKGLRRSVSSEFTKERMLGDKNINWKGSAVGYDALHDWVKRELGRPNKCEHCNETKELRYMHWANLTGRYKRDIADWIRLCSKCHFRFDGRDRTLKEFRDRPIKKITSRNKTGFKNVRMTPYGRFRAYITINGKQVGLGNYKTGEEAYEVYKKKAIELYNTY